MKIVSLIFTFLLFFSTAQAQVHLRAWTKSTEPPAIIPLPQKLMMLPGNYQVREQSVLINYLEMQHFSDSTSSLGTPMLDIRTKILEPEDVHIGDEGYILTIDSTGIFLQANNRKGLFYGHQTLRQIVMQSHHPQDAHLLLPHLSITDFPAFPWRGMLLDVSRHFMEKKFVLRYIDLLALYKMNVLHWHLTDDQGWRIEIPEYPNLTGIGAWRQKDGDSLYGGYYTRDDIREVVAYAAARNITVVPEIEMPGHAMAALAAYPHLSCTGGPFEVATTWGVFKDIFCAGNDSVFIFLQKVLLEVMGLFPSEHIHIGGDEAPKYRWEQCPQCQNRMANLHLESEHELQSWFIGEIAEFLNSHGRKLIGWDEIIEGGLVDGVTVQSWRSFEGARHAAETGNDAVVSPTSHAYFDYPIHKLTLEKVYNFDPVPEGLDTSLHHHILGGECNMWTERAPQHLVDQKVFPRILAMAEVLWSDPPTIDSAFTLRDGWTKIESPPRDYLQFRQRVRKHYPMLTALNVNYGLEEGGLQIFNTMTENGILVHMTPEQDNIIIRYTTGPDSLKHDIIYQKPIPLSGTITIHAAAYIEEQRVSEVFTRAYNIHPGIGLPYQLSMLPGGTYNKNPETTLTDGVRGTTDFHDGLWLGFWEKDVHISLSFKEPKEVSTVGIGFLQSNPSWIFMPAEVSITIKPQGILKKRKKYTLTSSTPQEILSLKKDLQLKLDKNIRIKKVKIHIKNPGKCPSWHPGAGSPTWVFIDEIFILE